MDLQARKLRGRQGSYAGRGTRGRASIGRMGSAVAAGTLLLSGLGAATAAPAQASTLTFINYTTTKGLGSNQVEGIFVDGSTIYAATAGGLSISTNGGATFNNRTTTNTTAGGAQTGLGSNVTFWLNASGPDIVVGTSGGLSISDDAGFSFTNRTTADGLGDNNVTGVYFAGSTIYAATQNNIGPTGGLSISTNGGASFVNRTTAQGLGSDKVRRVYVVGSTVYAATLSGLSISTDGGATFPVNRTTAQGLGSDTIRAVYVVGSTVYAGTTGGLSISTDGGATFPVNRTIAQGLGNNNVLDVYVVGATVYAATPGGLSVSTDGGATFTNHTTSNGLGSNFVNAVYAVGSTVYAATLSGLSIAATVPAAPSITSATADDASASIAFTPPGSDGGAAITNYEYRLDSGAWVPLSPASTTSPFTIPGLTNGQTYSVTLRAVNSVGAGAASAPVTVTPSSPVPPPPPPVFPPSAPLGVTGTAGDASAVVSWTAPADSGSFPVTNYRVVAAPGGASCLAAAPSLTCTVSGLTNGQPYTFTIEALNGAGWGPSSTASAPVTPRAAAVVRIVLDEGVRKNDGRHDRITTTGTTEGIPAGARLTPYIRYTGQDSFKPGVANITVQADGTFRWTRQIKKSKGVTGYVAYQTLESNRVFWAALR